MKRNLIILLFFIGLIGFSTSCEKDETKAVMLTSPIAPTIKTLPDLTLVRSKGADTIAFLCTSIDPGFQASAAYFLEACASGNNFKDSVAVISGIFQDTLMKITVGSLNTTLLKKFPKDQVSALDFRVRAVLNVDAGTGSKPLIYISETKSANVTLYGLPRIDLIGSGLNQIIESSLGDGKYFGIVKFDAAMPFTLKDPDANVVYGATGTSLVVNGNAITPPATGWHKFNVDTKELSFAMSSFMIGLVGSATPNAWNSPDQKMDYDAATGTWHITLDLIDGEIKFRLNDGWAWNLGYNPAKDALVHNGDNIPVTAGNYTITLTITKETAPETGTFTIVKN